MTVSVKQTFDLGLYAVSDDGSDVGVSGVDVVLSWDPEKIELIADADDGSYNWAFSGFLDDSQADGLNDSLADGDAYYQAVAQFSGPAVATAEGLHVTSFRFRALAVAEQTTLAIMPQVGNYAGTRVFQAGMINVDIAGDLGAADLAVLGTALLRALDVSIVAGRTATAVVSGEIDGRETFGVEVLLELAPKGSAVGSVEFTPAPPVDVEQAGDPWPGAGRFTPFDTHWVAFSRSLNGSADDDGVFLGAPVTYSGPLTAFPVMADAEAGGEWELRLSTETSTSGWVNLESVLVPGTLRVVSPGDGDGSTAIDFRDFSEMGACFTGPGDGTGGPSYSDDPSARCGVYDFDNDGDVDWEDYAGFHAVATGPAP